MTGVEPVQTYRAGTIKSRRRRTRVEVEQLDRQILDVLDEDRPQSVRSQMRKTPGQLPVIELGAETYRHKSYGNVEKPLLMIFGWIRDPGRSPSEASAGPASYAEELNDEIPF